tara:strand:+ start:1589 stop:2083 length:495 start_codon:yes stop_codon:yes gene_type:complete
MLIKVIKNFIYIGEFKLKCCIGKGGIKINKIEGDNATPRGIYKIGNLFYRHDKIHIKRTILHKIKITKNMGWCNDSNSTYYNKLFYISKKNNFTYEKLLRKDYKYNLLIPILYNYNKPKKNRGSAIFIHLTKDFKPTVGCIALKQKDFLVMLNLIKRNSKIRIY